MTANTYAGGIIGYGSYAILVRNCYATGDITAISNSSGAYAGGIAAYFNGIANCFATGKVYSNGVPRAYVGAIVGYDGGLSSVENSYQYENQVLMNGDEIIISDDYEICEIEQLNSQSFYTETLGWSEDIWDFSDLDFENGKLPTLK